MTAIAATHADISVRTLTSYLGCAACRRVGGAFGGKVARSMPVAAAAAVAAAKTGRRVRYSLNRNDDMRINGGKLGTQVVYWSGLHFNFLLHYLAHPRPSAVNCAVKYCRALTHRVSMKGGEIDELSSEW